MAIMDHNFPAISEPEANRAFRPLQVDMLLLFVMLSMAAAMLHFGPTASMVAALARNRSAAAALAATPPTPVPAVEPVKFVDMTPDQARDYNATVPFVAEHIEPARPFTYQGSPADRENALTCLASALWYEVGDDAIGEQAVAQVVLNRVRHPAFPKTVCGVVFEGSERKTGCQFTFACDGSLATRIPPTVQWQRARDIAGKSLSGFVFKPVGTATHYHTNWVVPYWASSLTKLNEIHTHIFYRWAGWWGLPQAFSGTIQSPEAIDPRIIALSQQAAVPQAIAGAVATGSGVLPTIEKAVAKIENAPEVDLKGNIMRLADPDHGVFVLQLDPHAFAGSYALTAFAICHWKTTCRVVGWVHAASMPDALPLDEGKMKTAIFRYQKTGSVELALWDCRVMPRDADSQCLPGTGSSRSTNGPDQTQQNRPEQREETGTSRL